jgi:hypothetical protein
MLKSIVKQLSRWNVILFRTKPVLLRHVVVNEWKEKVKVRGAGEYRWSGTYLDINYPSILELIGAVWLVDGFDFGGGTENDSGRLDFSVRVQPIRGVCLHTWSRLLVEI